MPELRVGAEEAGERLDRFLAEPLGSRAQAQRLIDAGRVRVDGRCAPKRHAVKRGELVIRRRASRRRRRRTASRRRRSRSPTRTSTCWWSTSPPESSSTRPAAIAAGRWRRRWRAGPPAARSRGGPGSCTAWTATRPVCSWSPRATTSTGRSSDARRAPAATGVRGAGGGPSRGPHRDDRRPDRTRPPRPRTDVDRHRRAARGPHPFRDRATAAAATLLRIVLDTGRTHQIRVHMAAIGHPVCGDREYGGAEGGTAWSASSCTPPGWPSPTR